MSSGINFATNERIIDHFWMLVGSLRRFSLRLDVLRKRAAISLRCKNEAFNISERYCSRSHYFCFWTACCQGIKDTLAKFESAVLVDVYHCLCVYRYFSHLLFENEAFNIFEQHSLPVFIEVFILLSRPDCSNSRVSVSTDRSSRPDRIVTIRWNICSFPQQFDFWQ